MQSLQTFPGAPRVAFFADTFYEANGVATLTRHLAEFARARNLPFLLVRGGRETRYSKDGSVETLELKRSAAAFPIDKTLYFDPFLVRHKKLLIRHLQEFKPDLIHITGPGDVGFLGVLLAHVLRLPSVASWHTNLHEYLSRRLFRVLNLMPPKWRRRAAVRVEREALRGLLRFYRSARFLLAPNQSMVDLLEARLARPAFLMPHGVDLSGYRPAGQRRNGNGNHPFCIGYVGRLTTEKNVRLFPDLERRLLAAGEKNYKFLIVGDGGQQKWLERHLKNAELTGVLKGAELAEAYSRMDAFVFPSLTDTFGLVILEAMASGLPVVLAPETGARVGIENGISGFLSEDFASDLQRLMHDQPLRAAMGCAARNFANHNGWDVVFEQLYRTYAGGLAGCAQAG